MEKHEESKWVEPASADNAISSITKTGDANLAHYIDKIEAGYDTTGTSGILTVTIGGTVEIERPVHDSASIDFPIPLGKRENENVKVELSASGSGGVLGYVNVVGHSY